MHWEFPTKEPSTAYYRVTFAIAAYNIVSNFGRAHRKRRIRFRVNVCAIELCKRVLSCLRQRLLHAGKKRAYFLFLVKSRSRSRSRTNPMEMRWYRKRVMKTSDRSRCSDAYVVCPIIIYPHMLFFGFEWRMNVERNFCSSQPAPH